jgi:hypothetical protein
MYNDHVKFNILRNKKKIEYNIKGVNIDSILTYNIYNSNKYIYYEGFIFVELSEDLLEYFQKEKLYIPNRLLLINPTIMKKKYIILIHIDYEYLHSIRKHGYMELKNKKYPYENKNVMILDKICNFKVRNLESLNNILQKKQFDNKLSFIFQNCKLETSGLLQDNYVIIKK